MNNEIGRKITSLTLMTIMLAGGMVIAAPSMMPAAHAANANLFVSAENSQFDNYMSGPQVIEVVVIDSDINDTDEAKGEPDVTVNGKIMRMVQAVDGNWYGYFADRTMSQIADSTAEETLVAGDTEGLDFGKFCSADSAISLIGVNTGDSNGVAVPAIGTVAGEFEGSANGSPITNNCAALTGAASAMSIITDDSETYDGLNVVREAKAPSNVDGVPVPTGQIGIEEDYWPFIQLYTLNPTGNVVIQYNKGGGAQTTTLTFDTVDQFAEAGLDRASYTPGAEIHATITDLWLNIDPTDEDSWTFGTTGIDDESRSTTHYQVFDENGATEGDTATNTDADLTNELSNLMCEDNCRLISNADVQNQGLVLTLSDNDDSEIVVAPASASNTAVFTNIGADGLDDPTTEILVDGTIATENPDFMDGFVTISQGNLQAGATFANAGAAGLDLGVLAAEIAAATLTGNDLIDFEDGPVTITQLNDLDNPISYRTESNFLAGVVPVTITEQGPNSGVFGTYDESDNSSIKITGDAKRGTSASLTYNEDSYTILVALGFGSVDIQPIDDEWSSGEEIPIELFDIDANQNSRADEDLDLNNPEVKLIPSIRTGSPATLSGLTSASLDGTDFIAPNGETLDDNDSDAVQSFSDRALLSVNNDDPVTGIVDGNSLILEFGTMDDFFDAAPIDDNRFQGFALFNYDIRSLTDNMSPIDSFDIVLAGETLATKADDQGLILIEGAPLAALSDMSGNDGLDVEFIINDVTGALLTDSNPDTGLLFGDLPNDTVLPVVADIFGFGFLNDGLEAEERIANQLIRLELEETGDNTSTFAGTLEYTMINQLNILDPDTYEDLSTISDETTFIVIEDLTDEDSPRVNYLDLGSDGVSTQVSDQEEAPSHSGIVSFDLDTYKTADTVIITLQDLDLNVDSDLIDIYTTVSNSNIESLNDRVGDDKFNFVFSDDDNLGRVLDVTFDDELWTASNEDVCTDSLIADGIDTGLAATGFTLIETDRDSGEFIGDFQIPARWCAEGDNSPQSATGLDIEVNYVDFRDASGEVIEVGDSAGVRANTGSISLDRTVYPVPFGVPDNFGDLNGVTSPDNRSIFAIHATGINDDLTEDGSFLPDGDLIIHLRVNDPDFDVSASGEDKIAQNQSGKTIGPVEISIIRGSETVILGYAGGPSTIDGTINVGSELIGDGMVSSGEITIDTSTTGFPSDNDGNADQFLSAAVTITQTAEFSASGDDETVDAIFTDNASNGIDSGSELNTLADDPPGLLVDFKSGLITITQDSAFTLSGDDETVSAIFTDSGAPGLGSGSEISQIATVGAGSVLICQSGMSTNDCAAGLFVNEGTEEIDESELEVQTSVDIVGTLPITLELDDVANPETTTAIVNWFDENDDTNVDDGELTIVDDGAGYTDGDILDIIDPNPVAPNPAIIGTVLFTDSLDTLETDELVISNPPSGNGFVNGAVTITPNPPISGVNAKGTFVDTPAITQFGPIDEIAPDAGIFELDVTIQYTDGPSDTKCPATADFDATVDGIQGELTRFNTAAPSGENYCILQGDILQVEYTDPTDASGDENSVTDSATFDLRNGVLQSDKSVYIIGSDMILTLIEPDLDLDNDQAETWDLDLIEWDSDAATITMGDADGEADAFDPEPLNFRETGDSTGIFQIVIEIPEELENDKLERGEEIILEYTDWGPSGSDFVGDEDEDVNVTLFTSNFGATVELDQKVYTWTDKVYMTIVAPDHNFDGDLIDEIGNTDDDPIKISTRGFDLDNYKLVETGTDTGIFTGEIILTGFLHDADGEGGDTDAGFDTNPRTTGDGPTDGFLQSDDDDGLTVSFEFSEDETIVGSSLIRWNIGEVQWLEASYPASGTGVVRVIDPDMNLDPEAVDNFDVDVWSDSDAGGIDLTVTETNEATGIFEGTVFFTVTDESSGHRLRVAEGDTVTAEYEDNTLPDPYTTADELDITATSLIGTIVPPLERAPAASLRTVDAFGNTLDSISVDQQVQISADLANGQDREQAFAYLVQIQDGNGVTVALAWITGSLAPGQSFSPALSWIPTQAGTYTATAFVWESIDNPTALSPPVSTTITVR